LQPTLTLDVISHDALDEQTTLAIIKMCNLAFEQPMETFIRLHGGGAHVLGRLEGRLVSHACWVPRRVQPAGLPSLQTAYIEDVGTHPDYQGKGFGSKVMRRMAEVICDLELGALATGSFDFYARLGWERWRGPSAVHTENGLFPTDEYGIMVLRLQKTPPFSLDSLITADWRPGNLW
jgi:aminoglycoside 2'-N-acetyltransferase I